MAINIFVTTDTGNGLAPIRKQLFGRMLTDCHVTHWNTFQLNFIVWNILRKTTIYSSTKFRLICFNRTWTEWVFRHRAICIFPTGLTCQTQIYLSTQYHDYYSCQVIGATVVGEVSGAPNRITHTQYIPGIMHTFSMCCGLLTPWGLGKMEVILQTTHSNSFSFSECHWSLFLRIQLTIF